MKSSSQSSNQQLRILRSQSRRQIQRTLKIQEREQEWNNRFFLERIPNYDYFHDPYSYARRPPSSGQANLVIHGHGNRRQLITRKSGGASEVARSREGSQDANKPSHRLCLKRPQDRQRQAIRKAFADLKRLWMEKAIPQCHIEAMTKVLSRENNLSKVLEDLKVQYTEIARDTSIIQKLANSVEVREGCIRSLVELLERIDERADLRNYAAEVEEKIQHLRILTIHSVECILQWKQQIWGLRGPDCIFRYRSGSYIEKIQKDLEWIKKSKIGILYEFPEKNDYFLATIRSKGFGKSTPTSKNLLKRIKYCQQIMQKLGLGERITSAARKPPTPPAVSLPLSPPPVLSATQNLKLDQQTTETQLLPSQPAVAITNPTPKPRLRLHSIEYQQFHSYVDFLCRNSPMKQTIAGKVDFFKYQQCTVISVQDVSHFVIGVDRSASHRKIVLLLANVTDENFQKHFEEVCGYLWRNDTCMEIRVNLYHVDQDGTGNAKVPEKLEENLKGLGFKWVCVCNNDDGVRLTAYMLKRPADIRVPDHTQDYPLIVEQFTVFKTIDGERKPNTSPLNILFLVRLICDKGTQEQQQQIISDPAFQPYLVKLDNIARFKYSGLKPFMIRDLAHLHQISSTGTIKPVLPVPCLLSFLNTSYRFRNRYIVNDNYMKFFPDKDNEIVVCDSEYPVYLLPTDEESVSVFIFEVGADFTENQIEKVFKGRGSQAVFQGELWVPVFRKEEQYADQLGLQNKVLASMDFRNILQSIKTGQKASSVAIKPPFVFGLTHRQLLQTLEVPFFATLITKQNLV